MKLYVMNFFNKYKGLFGVPQGTPIPRTKLSLNNNLFIDKPFVPTYQQTLSINSKLRDLRKDYNELQHQIDSISMTMKSPKRAISRRSRQVQQQREKKLNNSMKQGNSPRQPSTKNSNNVSNSPFIKHNRSYMKINNIENRNNFQQLSSSQQMKDPLTKKRITWLRDEQINLQKHSQMNFIFNHKIQQENQKLKKINDMPMPKVENFMFGVSNDNQVSSNNHGSRVTLIRNESFKPTNRTRILQVNSQVFQKTNNTNKRDSNRNQLDKAGAIKRRQQAKRNINQRRQKLGYLIRTSW